MALCPKSCSIWWKGFSHAPGLLFIVLTFLINLVVWAQMDYTLESVYALVVWILEGACAAVWTGGIIFITTRQRTEEDNILRGKHRLVLAGEGDEEQERLREKAHSEVSSAFRNMRLAVYLTSTAACMVVGLALGPWGLKLLLRDNLRPSERIAVVMLDTTVMWVQGVVELVNFSIHFYLLKSEQYGKVQDSQEQPPNPR